jgi:hypothetical protein
LLEVPPLEAQGGFITCAVVLCGRLVASTAVVGGTTDDTIARPVCPTLHRQKKKIYLISVNYYPLLLILVFTQPAAVLTCACFNLLHYLLT